MGRRRWSTGRGSCGTKPDGSGYWRGTPEEYDKLYDYTADAIKRALPTALVGGPGTTGPGGARAPHFSSSFWNHCAHGANAVTGKTGAPLDSSAITPRGRRAWSTATPVWDSTITCWTFRRDSIW